MTQNTSPYAGDTAPELRDWLCAIQEQVSETLGWSVRLDEISLLCPQKNTLDDPAKYRIRGPGGAPAAVLYVSPPTAADVVYRHIDHAAAAHEVLGPELGRVVLEPLCAGEAMGLSYALMPYCQELSRRRGRGYLERIVVRPRLFRWLRAVTARTVEPFPRSDGDAEIQAALTELNESRILDPRFQPRVVRAAERLASGAWRPRRVLMHADLWDRNILIAPRAIRPGRPFWWQRLALIDWPASRIDGFAFYDLARLAISLRPGFRRLRAEIEAHSALLGCDPSDSWSYLAAALGYLGLHREHFAMDLYVAIARECMETLEAAGV